jgi:hypothetical protein
MLEDEKIQFNTKHKPPLPTDWDEEDKPATKPQKDLLYKLLMAGHWSVIDTLTKDQAWGIINAYLRPRDSYAPRRPENPDLYVSSALGWTDEAAWDAAMARDD